MNYEERREKIKLLFLELIDNKEQLRSFLNVPEGQYSLITLDASVLDRLLVDIYSVLQRSDDLVNTLLTLRRQIRVCNAKTTIFFSQMAMPLVNQKRIASEHNAFMKEKAEHLIPFIDDALGVIEAEYNLHIPSIDAV